MMQTAIGILLIAVISLASCKKAANTAPAYTDRERLLLDTTNNHTRNIDSLMVLVDTYSKQGDRCREMAALAALGHGYQTSNRYSDAVKAHQKQLTIAEELDDTLMKASALNDLGVNYRRLGLHYDGLDYHLRAVETSLLYPPRQQSEPQDAQVPRHWLQRSRQRVSGHRQLSEGRRDAAQGTGCRDPAGQSPGYER